MYLMANPNCPLYATAGNDWISDKQEAEVFKVKDLVNLLHMWQEYPTGIFVLSKDEFVQHIAANHKTGKWIRATFWVDDGVNPVPVEVSVKAFGKWVQRMETWQKPYWSGAECKTVGTFKDAIRSGLEYLLS